MCALVECVLRESPAGKPAGPDRPAKRSGTTKYVLRQHQYEHGCTLQKREKWRTKSLKKVCTGMYSVHTGTYHFMTLKYVPGTYFFRRVCTQKHTFSSSMYSKTYIFLSVWTWYIPVHTRGKKVCTEYILRVKSMYQVQTGLCPFISVPYYSMVHTGMYRYVLGTYHCSRFQM